MLKQAPNLKLVIRELSALDGKMIEAAARGLERGLILTAGVVQQEYLSGPRPEKLDHLTGRLFKSIEVKVTKGKETVTGSIGTNVPYGAYHEYGLQGTVKVKAHSRTVNQASTVEVKAHERKVDYKGRPFVRPAVLANRGMILREINEEIGKTLTGGNGGNGEKQ